MMDPTTLLIAAAVLVGTLLLGFLLIIGMAGRDDRDRRSRRSGPDPGAGSGGPGANRPKYNWLVARSGPLEGKSFHLGQRLGTVGRGLGNFIQVSDDSVSDVHMQFRGAASGMQVKDMGSSNGTEINGEPIEEDTFVSVEDGDEIKVGETVFAYWKTGDFHDDALTGAKDVQASQMRKTMGLGAVGGGGPGGLEQNVLDAVEENDGDHEKAAEQLNVDVDFVDTIVNVAQREN